MPSSSWPCCFVVCCVYSVFFFNDTAPTEIYTLSLHDALPIFPSSIITSAGWRPGPALVIVGHRDSLRQRSEEHTSELQSRLHLVCRLLLEKKKNTRQPRKRRRKNLLTS